MLSKRISKFAPALAGAALAGLGVSQALATLTVDLRASAVSGGGSISADKKTVTGFAVGSTVTMQVWAQVTGSAGNNTPGIAQSLQTVTGSFLSGNGPLLGNLVTAAPPLAFRANSSSVGFSSDLDGDGDLDVGSNNPADNANFFSARSSKLLGPQSNADGSTAGLTANAIAGGTEYFIELLRFVVGPAATGSTQVNFRPLNTAVGGVWAENTTETSVDNGDGTTSYTYGGGTNGDPSSAAAYHSGLPVNIGVGGGTVPEPASLGLIGAAGLGLLARRRKD